MTQSSVFPFYEFIKKQDTIKNPLALAALATPTRIAIGTRPC